VSSSQRYRRPHAGPPSPNRGSRSYMEEQRMRDQIKKDANWQRCGSGSVGSIFFWASWILLSSSKNSKINLDSYYSSGTGGPTPAHPRSTAAHAPMWRNKGCGGKTRFKKMSTGSVTDPDPNPDPLDPNVFGTPGSVSGPISHRYGSGSGSFYHQAKIVRKTLIPTFCDFFLTFYL
jgi:hypothetical protein